MHAPRLPAPLRRLRRRLGHRGAALTLLGLVYIALGGNRILNPAITQDVSIPWAHWVHGAWVACGCAAVYFAFRNPRDRIPDWPGFACLAIPAMAWTFLYVWSWIEYQLTDGTEGSRSGLLPAVYWAAITALVSVIAGWGEPSVKTDDGE